MLERKIFTPNDLGEKLVGLESLPAEARERYPVVILVHGLNYTKEEGGKFDELAKRFTKSGCSVYRFDFSGCGESEGDYSQTSLSKLAGDLSSIIKFVKSQPMVEASRFGILTQSFGGPVAIALAPEASALVFVGAFAHPLEMISPLFSEYNPSGISVRKYADGRALKMGPQFWADFQKHDLIEQVEKIKCPKFFVHAGADEKIPLAEMAALYEAAPAPKEKLIVPGLNHDWSPDREKMYQPVVSWLAKQLMA